MDFLGAEEGASVASDSLAQVRDIQLWTWVWRWRGREWQWKERVCKRLWKGPMTALDFFQIQ